MWKCLFLVVAFVACTSALIGDRCPTNKCTVGNCNDGTCLCLANNVPSANRKKCLPVAQQLGSGCEEERQCSTKLGRFATCIGHQCGCTIGSSVKHGVCLKTGTLLGDRCIGNRCDVGACTKGVCSCRAHVEIPAPSKDACLQVASTLGSGCETNQQCTQKLGNNAHCVNYQCGCKNNAVVVNGVCQRQ